MMLCALSSLCHAQMIRFEYDSNGFLKKRFLTSETLSSTFADKYELKIGPSPTNGPVHIQVFQVNSNQLAEGRMEVKMTPAISFRYSGVNGSFDKCDGKMDIGSISAGPSGVWSVIVVVYPNGQSEPVSCSIKIIKN